MKNSYVYILTNNHHNVLYVGVTSNLEQRIFQHKTKYNPKSFTARYNIHKLVYFEHFTDITDAIAREKQLKAGSREKKENLINSSNTTWADLAADWYD